MTKNLIQRLFGRQEKPLIESLPEVTIEKLDYDRLISLLGRLDLKVKLNVLYKLPLAGDGQFNDANCLDLIDFLEREFKEYSICFKYRTEAEHKITQIDTQEHHTIEVIKKRLNCYLGNQESWRSAGHEASIDYVLTKSDLTEEKISKDKIK